MTGNPIESQVNERTNREIHAGFLELRSHTIARWINTIESNGMTPTEEDIRHVLDYMTPLLIKAGQRSAVVNVCKATTDMNGYPKENEHLAPLAFSSRTSFMARKSNGNSVIEFKTSDLP